MLEAIRNAFRLPDLRRKLLVTIGILVLYRFAAHIPLPGVNRDVLDQIFNSQSSGTPGTGVGSRPARIPNTSSRLDAGSVLTSSVRFP